MPTAVFEASTGKNRNGRAYRRARRHRRIGIVARAPLSQRLRRAKDHLAQRPLDAAVERAAMHAAIDAAPIGRAAWVKDALQRRFAVLHHAPGQRRKLAPAQGDRPESKRAKPHTGRRTMREDGLAVRELPRHRARCHRRRRYSPDLIAAVAFARGAFWSWCSGSKRRLPEALIYFPCLLKNNIMVSDLTIASGVAPARASVTSRAPGPPSP